MYNLSSVTQEIIIKLIQFEKSKKLKHKKNFHSCAMFGTNQLFPFSDFNIYSCTTRGTNLLFLFSDNNGTQILLKITKGGWFSVLRNIYQNDVKELLKQNGSLVIKREFYFALKLLKDILVNAINNSIKRQLNISLFEEVCMN